MRTKNLADKTPTKSLTHKEKKSLALLLAVMLPLLILVYLFIDSLTPEDYQVVNGRGVVNEGLVLMFTILLVVFGMAMFFGEKKRE